MCSELKPQFHKFQGKLIHATQPLERLNIDFKGPLPSVSQNKYLLTIIDEYSRFPFAFPCPDMNSTTVIKCFNQLFSIFGMPGYVHSDRGRSLISTELKDYLNSKGVATSRTSAYNPKCNGQVERYNGIIWKTINLALKSNNLHVSQWENVLTDSLHSIRSLLCTSTNCSPHERLFNYQRRSTSGNAVPTWLITPGTVLIKRHNRQSKYDPLVEEVEVLDTNPEYAHVKFSNGRESTVSLRNLAPHSKTFNHPVSNTPVPLENHNLNEEMNNRTHLPEINNDLNEISSEQLHIPTEENINAEECDKTVINEPVLRRS